MSTSDTQRETLLQTIETRADLGGRFCDIKRLNPSGGDGHFSLIMTALDRETARRVALKFFNPIHLKDQYRWNSFLREPQVLSLFQGKPDILQCLAPLEEFTIPFEFNGLTLPIPFSYYAVELGAHDVNSAILSGRWTPLRKLEAFRGMCRAVQRLHLRGVVHRDLKPSNFLVMDDGTLRLSDFGTARDLSDLNGKVSATYHFQPGDMRYAAPEMIACLHDVNPSFAVGSDIYALGAILFELFASTQLVVNLFDIGTIATLQQSMAIVDRTVRVNTYNSFVNSLADSSPLPSLSQFTGNQFISALPQINRLYQFMCAIDYRVRLTDFSKIFSLLKTSVWVLEHADAFRRRKLFRESVRRTGQTTAPTNDSTVRSRSILFE